MIIIKRSEKGADTPGTWRPLLKKDETYSASIRCPECKCIATLLAHEIAEDGTVSPSVQCPWTCNFHEMVKLEGWPP